MMSSFDILDICRENDTQVKRFTWRGPQNKQARLDYFLISSDLVSFISDLIIHCFMILITFRKLKNALQIRSINKLPEENGSPKFYIEDQLLWEILKIMIRSLTRK